MGERLLGRWQVNQQHLTPPGNGSPRGRPSDPDVLLASIDLDQHLSCLIPFLPSACFPTDIIHL